MSYPTAKDTRERMARYRELAIQRHEDNFREEIETLIRDASVLPIFVLSAAFLTMDDPILPAVRAELHALGYETKFGDKMGLKIDLPKVKT